MVLGITGTSAWNVERILSMKPGETIEFAGYDLAFDKLATRQGPNYDEIVGDFRLSEDGKLITLLNPSKRQYVAPATATTEAAIHASWAGDFYLVISETGANEAASVGMRIYFHPLVRLIWLGTFIMFLGGVISLSDRRLRVGAPQRRASGVRAAGSVEQAS
jgi:cytochrome c-type biogenesis protein CcmF